MWTRSQETTLWLANKNSVSTRRSELWVWLTLWSLAWFLCQIAAHTRSREICSHKKAWRPTMLHALAACLKRYSIELPYIHRAICVWRDPSWGPLGKFSRLFSLKWATDQNYARQCCISIGEAYLKPREAFCLHMHSKKFKLCFAKADIPLGHTGSFLEFAC